MADDEDDDAITPEGGSLRHRSVHLAHFKPTGNAAIDNLIVPLDGPTDPEDLLTRRSFWATLCFYPLWAVFFLRQCLLYLWASSKAAARWIDQKASVLLGNRRRWVGEPGGLLDSVVEWYQTYRSRLQLYGTIVLVLGIIVYITAVWWLLGPVLSRSVHTFVPLDATALVFETTMDLPEDFVCPCTALGPSELEDNAVASGVDPERAEASGIRTRASLSSVLAVNAALLSPTHASGGGTIMVPKLWNTTANARDRAFVEHGHHRFNPCILTIQTNTSGLLHLINPVLLNDNPMLPDDARVPATKDVVSRDSLRSFSFLSTGVATPRYSRILVRYRTVPHLELPVTREFAGEDALAIQAGLQLLGDAYEEALRRARGFTTRMLRTHPDVDLRAERVRFDVNSEQFEYETNVKEVERPVQ